MSDYSLVSILKILHKWRKPVVYGTGAIFVLSIVVSLVLPVYYESTTIFYAASEDLFKPKKVLGYSDTDIEYYGSTEDIQRILTLATSHELTSYLVEEFDLYSHYNIDSSKTRARYYVREELLDHYKVIRTKYDALELTVEDRDPFVAAEMANAAREKIATMIGEIIRSSQEQVINSYELTIRSKEDLLLSLNDTLSMFQKQYGIIDPEAQTEYLSTLVTSSETTLAGLKAKRSAYESSQARGARDSIAVLNGQIAALETQLSLLTSEGDTTNESNYNISRFIDARGRVAVLSDAYSKAVNTVNIDKELLKQLRSAYNLSVPAVHVVENAEVPIIKSRPKRSLLVLTSTVVAFIFLCLGVLLIESTSATDWSFLKKW